MGEYDLPSDKEDKEFVPEFGWNGAVLNAPHVTDEVREELSSLNYKLTPTGPWADYVQSSGFFALASRACICVAFSMLFFLNLGNLILQIAELEKVIQVLGYSWETWWSVMFPISSFCGAIGVFIQIVWVWTHKKRANQN